MKKILINILRNKYLYFLILLINIGIILLGGFACTNLQETKTADKYINSYLNIKDLYIVINSWSLEDNEYVLKMDKKVNGGITSYTTHFENKMKDSGTKQYKIEDIANYIAYNFNINQVKNNPKFQDKLTYIGNLDGKPNNVEIFLGKPFGLQIKYPIIRGRNFIEDDYENKNNEYWNVIAGYEFTKEFALGDTLKLVLPGEYDPAKPTIKPEEVLQKVRIVGFIKKDTEILENLTDGRLTKADNKLIIPLKGKVNNEFLRTVKYSFLSMGSNFIITKEPKEVEKLLFEEAKRDGYKGKGTFIQIKEPNFEYKNYRIKGNEESFKTYSYILGGATITIILVTALSLLLLIRKNRYNYGVILLNGGSKGKILMDILSEMVVVLISADVLSLLFFIKYFHKILPIKVIGLHNLFILCIVYFLGLLIMKKIKVIYFIKFNNNSN